MNNHGNELGKYHISIPSYYSRSRVRRNCSQNRLHARLRRCRDGACDFRQWILRRTKRLCRIRAEARTAYCPPAHAAAASTHGENVSRLDNSKMITEDILLEVTRESMRRGYTTPEVSEIGKLQAGNLKLLYN